jgi:hypothetical protein
MAVPTAASSPTMLRGIGPPCAASYVHSTCTKVRQPTVTGERERASNNVPSSSVRLLFALFRATCVSFGLVVRDRIELSTFRFSGGRSYRLSYLTWLDTQ